MRYMDSIYKIKNRILIKLRRNMASKYAKEYKQKED
jgi:hypothetical protein